MLDKYLHLRLKLHAELLSKSILEDLLAILKTRSSRPATGFETADYSRLRRVFVVEAAVENLLILTNE